MRESTLSVQMHGCDIELELYVENGEQRSQCHVTHGEYHGSLELLLNMGYLEDANERTTQVKREHINRIYRWALDNGY